MNPNGEQLTELEINSSKGNLRTVHTGNIKEKTEALNQNGGPLD